MKERKIAALLLGAAVLGLYAITAHLASAHTHPIRFDPAPGAVLEAPPQEVSGWFTNPLRRDPNWTYLRVVDAEGTRVDTDEVELSEDRRQMTVGLQSGLEPGMYRVDYRIWDDNDGHILGDCFKFYIGQEAADAAVADSTRLFGGGDCERIDVSARDGTPTPEELTPTPEPEPGAEGEGADGGGDDGDGGVPVWALALGIIGGVVAGGVGMKLAGSRA